MKLEHIICRLILLLEKSVDFGKVLKEVQRLFMISYLATFDSISLKAFDGTVYHPHFSDEQEVNCLIQGHRTSSDGLEIESFSHKIHLSLASVSSLF